MEKRYKFLQSFKSEYRDHYWEMDKWYKTEGELEMCGNGFHCSKRIGDAFHHVQGNVLAEVECRGKNLKDDDKEVWEEMRVVRAWKWTKIDSVKLAIFTAEQVIDIFEGKYPEDDRPRKAIEAAKNFIKNPCEETQAVARNIWAAGDDWANWAAGDDWASWAAGAALVSAAAAWNDDAIESARANWSMWSAWNPEAEWSAGNDRDALFDTICTYMEELVLEEILIEK